MHANFRNAEFWRNLNPSLHINGEPLSDVHEEIDPIGADVIEHLREYGYCKVPSGINHQLIAKCCAAIEVLQRNKILPVWAFVYDEFWSLISNPNMQSVCSSLLGDYFLIPDFWAMRVGEKGAERGFLPHADAPGYVSVDQMGAPVALTCWLALTDATTENGCIYLIPANIAHEDGYPHGSYFDPVQVVLKKMCHRVKAIPAKRGDLLIWNHGIFHWGSSRSNLDSSHRLSISFEVLSRKVSDQPHPHSYFSSGESFNPPLLKRQSDPSFSLRIKLVAKQIVSYSAHAELVPGSIDLAKTILCQ